MTARDLDLGSGRIVTIQEAGDPAGLPVFVHHGTPCSRLLYETWVQDVSERGIRLVGFDRPGYGHSARWQGRSVADIAGFTAAIADELGIERFASWGISGGGPHVLACAALLPDRVIAAASLASVVPYEADGVDFFEGMGDTNLEEFGAAVEGEEKLRPLLEEYRKEILASDPLDVPETLESLLSPPDLAVHSGEMAGFLHEWTAEGIRGGVDGWLDDDLAFAKPWGFQLSAISIPVLLWQGRQDLMVPYAHGEWLAQQVPGVDARLTEEDGHLTLIEKRVRDTHAWLLKHA